MQRSDPAQQTLDETGTVDEGLQPSGLVALGETGRTIFGTITIHRPARVLPWHRAADPSSPAGCFKISTPGIHRLPVQDDGSETTAEPPASREPRLSPSGCVDVMCITPAANPR